MSGPSFVQQARTEIEVVKNEKKVLRRDHPCPKQDRYNVDTRNKVYRVIAEGEVF